MVRIRRRENERRRRQCQQSLYENVVRSQSHSLRLSFHQPQANEQSQLNFWTPKQGEWEVEGTHNDCGSRQTRIRRRKEVRSLPKSAKRGCFKETVCDLRREKKSPHEELSRRRRIWKNKKLDKLMIPGEGSQDCVHFSISHETRIANSALTNDLPSVRRGGREEEELC